MHTRILIIYDYVELCMLSEGLEKGKDGEVYEGERTDQQLYPRKNRELFSQAKQRFH